MIAGWGCWPIVRRARCGALARCCGGPGALRLGRDRGDRRANPARIQRANCPSSNPPNQMTLVAGTPQTATLGQRLCDRPAGRAHQQRWVRRHERRRGRPRDVQRTRQRRERRVLRQRLQHRHRRRRRLGAVAAPPFTANGTAGSYTVTASSQYGSVSFSLTNTAAGIPARIVAIPLTQQIGQPS